MAYLTNPDELHALIPGRFVVEALDDDGDGSADAAAWAMVVAAACDQIDSRLEGRFEVPFLGPPYPAIVREAALVFAAEILYQRRGQSGETANPHTARANGLRAKLDNIGQGKAPLAPEAGHRAKPPISIISAPSRTAGANLHF
jgi:phage gp36-like protein